MATTHFQEIAMTARSTGKCSVCGKRTTRSRKFWQTVNPFNRNADGDPKSADEVRAEVDAEAARWEPDHRHELCAELEGHTP